MEIIKELSDHDISCRVLCCSTTHHSCHWHSKYELCRCLDDCDFLIDGAHINARGGDILAINEQSVHKFLVNEENTRIRVLQFPFDVILNFDIQPPSILTHIKATQIEKIPSLDESVEYLFSLIEAESPCHSAAQNPLLQSLINSLYFLLARHFPQDEYKTTTKKSRLEFYKIVDYINTHFSNDISVQSIADSLYMSRAKITSVFSAYSGVPISDYIRSVRIKNANRLISRGCSITEAAFASGFQNTRTFNNVYRRTMGMTPSEYEKNLKEK
jgi:AraC-like DNA-binding protein